MKEKNRKKVSCENDKQGKIIPTEEIKDEKLKRKLKTLSFLCNMAVLKE